MTGTFPQDRSAERPTEPSQPASASAAIATIQPRAWPPAPTSAADRRGDESGGESAEENAERAPLHARSLILAGTPEIQGYNPARTGA